MKAFSIGQRRDLGRQHFRFHVIQGQIEFAAFLLHQLGYHGSAIHQVQAPEDDKIGNDPEKSRIKTAVLGQALKTPVPLALPAFRDRQLLQFLMIGGRENEKDRVAKIRPLPRSAIVVGSVGENTGQPPEHRRSGPFDVIPGI